MSPTHTCPKCGALLKAGTKACRYCGTDTRGAAAPGPLSDAAATARVGMWIIGINVTVFVLMLMLDPTRGDLDHNRIDPSPMVELSFGLSSVPMVKHCGQYWRLLTAVFVHLDLLHLLLNSFALFILTPLAAVTFGMHRTICLYLVAGVVAALGSHLWGTSGAGASGAICGLIGALAVYGKRRGGFEGRYLTRRMLGWAVLILVWGLVMQGIDNVAHGVGFAAGAGLGWWGAGVRARGGRADRIWKGAAIACVALFAAVAVVWQVPSILRGLERRDVEIYVADAHEAMTKIEAVVGGARPVETLPRTAPEEGPAGAEAFQAALEAALEAAREDPSSSGAREALDAARAAWREWLPRLRCSHIIWDAP